MIMVKTMQKEKTQTNADSGVPYMGYANAQNMAKNV